MASAVAYSRKHAMDATRQEAVDAEAKHVPHTGSRTSSATATAARASNYPSKGKWWTSSSTCAPKVAVLAERLCHVGGGRHGRAQAARAAAGHTKSAAARAGAADVGAASTKTGAVRRLLRPAAASVVLRRSAGATAVRSLRWRDGVVLCLRHALGLPAAPRPSPAEFADRGAASLLATLDAPAWTPQQRPQRPPPRPDTELASDLRQLGLADPPRPPRPQVPDPSPPWLAGMLDEAPPQQPLGAFDRAPPATQPPPPPGLTEASEPTWASAATRPAGAPPLPRPRASSVSSSVASDGASALDRIALKVVPVDEQKTPWLATADLPARRAAPIEQLRAHTQSAVEAGNASAIQKLKRRRETRKRAKRGDHCRVEVRPRDGGGVFVSAYGVNAAGAGAALRRMLTANAALLAGRDVDATADDTPETRQNLGWAELVAQLRSILARAENLRASAATTCPERSSGTSVQHWSRRCSATTSPWPPY